MESATHTLPEGDQTARRARRVLPRQGSDVEVDRREPVRSVCYRRVGLQIGEDLFLPTKSGSQCFGRRGWKIHGLEELFMINRLQVSAVGAVAI